MGDERLGRRVSAVVPDGAAVVHAGNLRSREGPPDATRGKILPVTGSADKTVASLTGGPP
ncbi:hypothetical protein GCM10017752_34450 [Streptomyces roseoviridis]